MKKPRRAPRARTELRKLRRDHDKLVESRERLALLEAGGSAERPLDVASASQVEPRAEALGCLRCDGPLRTLEHTAEAAGGELLRVCRLACKRCGGERRVFLRIRPPLAN